jgi:GT2 family glycosyltransferase
LDELTLGDHPPVLSIVIVNWNTKKLLHDCLESIILNPPQRTHKIIVVDNGSTDGSGEMVQRNFGDVLLISNERNLGFAAANNQGISAQESRYVHLLNSDTIVLPGSLDGLITSLESSPAVGIVGNRLRNPDGTLQPSVFRFPTVMSALLLGFGIRRVKLGDRVRYTQTNVGGAEFDYGVRQEVDYMRGASLIIRRSVLDAIGLLDERFFMYGEEADLCYRAWQAGWKVMYDPEAEIIHLGGGSSRKAIPETIARRTIAVWQFIRKHHGPLAGFAFRTLAIARSLFSVCVQYVKFLFTGDSTWRGSWYKLRALLVGGVSEG